MSPTLDLLALGLTTLDIAAYPVAELPPPDSGMLVEAMSLAPAGTAGGCALVAATLGLRTAIASAVGDDPQGMLVRSLFAARDVDVTMLVVDSNYPTSTTILPVRRDGQRPNLHLMGASVFAPIPAAAFALLPRTRAVHWGGVGMPGLQAEGPSFLAAARAAGAMVTCDLIAPQEQTRDALRALLPHVDVFMPSLVEVRFLTGDDALDRAGEQFLAQGAQACLFKLGAGGAYYVSGEERIHVPSFAIDPVDTTSCGDSFCAGFIAARSRGMPIAAAMRFAAATAALVAQGLGTLGKLTDFDTTLSYAHTAPLRDRVTP